VGPARGYGLGRSPRLQAFAPSPCNTWQLLSILNLSNYLPPLSLASRVHTS